MLPILLGIIITNLTNGTSPWNITVPTNPLDFPNIILVNMPWFFPLITMFFTALSFYLITLKANEDTRTMLLVVAFAYTVLTYVEVLGSLTNIGWFFTFEVITMLVLYIITLFVPEGTA